jgi:hypothetical protein
MESSVTQEKEAPISGNTLIIERLVAYLGLEIAPLAVSKKSRVLEILWTKSPYSRNFVDAKQPMSEKQASFTLFLSKLTR